VILGLSLRKALREPGKRFKNDWEAWVTKGESRGDLFEGLLSRKKLADG